MTPDANDLCVFAVKRGYIESKEIYCNPLYPTYLSLVEKYQHSPYANGILNNHVAVNPKTDCSLLSDSSEVSFVPMANVQEKTNVVSYDMVAYETVKKGFTVFQRGDLIWAKITPCMQNGKSCIVDKMPTEIGFGSTEFHVIRKRNENVYMPFIWAILSSDDVLKAAQATFSGSAGQQRVSASFIENFPAVLPDYPVQVRLVAELEDKLNLLNGKLQRAYELLHKTPMYLIDRLGLTFDFSATQKITYATTVANIQPIGSVFEHSNQQKRFFTKEKFDEKFQKRIDYFSKVAMSFFANHGYDTEGFTINPYMVVNKVFSSYYKHVQFPIVTFDELKREIQL